METLSDKLPPDMKPHALSRKLNAASQILEQQYGVKYRTSRTMDARIIRLSIIVHDAMTQNGPPSEPS